MVSLTKGGQSLVRLTGALPQGQKLYSGLVKPREIEHDAQIYRAYRKEADRIEQRGGTNLRVKLDFELKSDVQKAIHAARKTAPEREMAEIKQQVAQQFELPYVNDAIQIPDARIEYDMDQGSRTGHGEYRGIDCRLSCRPSARQGAGWLPQLRLGLGSRDTERTDRRRPSPDGKHYGAITMTTDPIPALQLLGYTDREAAFLYLVAAHSGYFLRRQFDYFIDRNKGSIVINFLKKAIDAGHIEVFDYKQGWRVYHLCSRSIYRLLGDSESQLRRRKGDAQIRARLMALDYVLENENDHYLESEEDRIHLFENFRRISPNFFTDCNRRLQPLLSAFPVALADKERPAQSSVRFAFIDEGLLSIGKFVRFLGEADPLLRRISNFEIVYVALSEFNFHAAGAAFHHRFFDVPRKSAGLFKDEVRAPAIGHHAPMEAQFTTLLFRYSYPTILRSGPRVPIGFAHLPRRRLQVINCQAHRNGSANRWAVRGWERPGPSGLIAAADAALVAPTHILPETEAGTSPVLTEYRDWPQSRPKGEQS